MNVIEGSQPAPGGATCPWLPMSRCSYHVSRSGRATGHLKQYESAEGRCGICPTRGSSRVHPNANRGRIVEETTASAHDGHDICDRHVAWSGLTHQVRARTGAVSLPRATIGQDLARPGAVSATCGALSAPDSHASCAREALPEIRRFEAGETRRG